MFLDEVCRISYLVAPNLARGRQAGGADARIWWLGERIDRRWGQDHLRLSQRGRHWATGCSSVSCPPQID